METDAKQDKPSFTPSLISSFRYTESNQELLMASSYAMAKWQPEHDCSPISDAC